LRGLVEFLLDGNFVLSLENPKEDTFL
jgi:hypothetical protein